MFVVMSDSHYDREVIKSIKEKYQNTASHIFHCGDSELPSSDEIWKGITVVAGNCDYDDGYPEYVLKEVEGKNVLITHGHLFYVGLGLEHYSYFAEEKEADIALFGHIHRPVVQKINHTVYVNPGSVAQPRGEYDIKMYAVIEIEEEQYNISYHNLQHEPIPELQFKL
ncbi:metallophosphoesterase [Lactococcus allomyrinae]|uniref:Phosphoesterase n=1 Tax=Lactococcus allomyrinae TaxID=2419773 RepID=A0A387BG31_9LACT|nr:metallophosphoesterase [Lactococcus allomyrinae]AYG00379.1 metallophosphoesterase [Lactococcus allomyrinae]